MTIKILPEDEEDVHYMLRKLSEKYKNRAYK